MWFYEGRSPICFYDSSHDQNGDTFKNQYGFTIYWMGGPILWASKGHKHAGLSVVEDEYMTLTHVTRVLVVGPIFGLCCLCATNPRVRNTVDSRPRRIFLD